MFGGSGVAVIRSKRVCSARAVPAAAWLTLLLALSGCGHDQPSLPPAAAGSASTQLPGLFEECTAGRACEAGLDCITADGSSRCQHLCQNDGDCDFMVGATGEEARAVCGTLTKEVKACTRPCGKRYNHDFACIDGHPVECSALDEKSCAVCGCPDELRCEPNVGCHGKLGVDAECLEDSDCVSDNCDSYTHVCRVPVGSSCTEDNCERCVVSRNGTFCSRACKFGDVQCNGSACEYQMCVPLCAGQVDATCLGECVEHLTGIYACDCDPMQCTVVRSPKVGDPCDQDRDCGLDGVCLLNHPLAHQGMGVCSRRCNPANPCTERQSCVDVPCGENDLETCGALCLYDCVAAEPRCSGGDCRSLENIEAQSVEVCDYRKPAAAFCEAHNDCQSTICTDGMCAAGP